MLKRALKVLISLAVWAGDTLVSGVSRFLGAKPKPRGVVLYYHGVPAELRQRFAQQMDELKRMAHPVRCDVTAGLAPGERYAAVSFDDGFVSVVENALPELEARRIPATMFIPTCCLGAAPSWMNGQGRASSTERVVSAETLEKLRSHDLLTIGSHSVSHPNFLRLSESQARQELVESKRALQGIWGGEISMFSFPHGAFSSRLIEMVREAGYQRAFTIEPTLAFSKPGDVVIGRVAADPRDWNIEFRLKLLGAYRWNTHKCH